MMRRAAARAFGGDAMRLHREFSQEKKKAAGWRLSWLAGFRAPVVLPKFFARIAKGISGLAGRDASTVPTGLQCVLLRRSQPCAPGAAMLG